MYTFPTQKSKKSFTYHITAVWYPTRSLTDVILAMLSSDNPSLQANILLTKPTPYSEYTRFPIQRHTNLSSLGIVPYLRIISTANTIGDFTYHKVIDDCTFDQQSFETYYRVKWETLSEPDMSSFDNPHFAHTLTIVPYLCPPEYMFSKQTCLMLCSSVTGPSSDKLASIYALMARKVINIITNTPAEFHLSLFSVIDNYPITYNEYSKSFTLDKKSINEHWLTYCANLSLYTTSRKFVPLVTPVAHPLLTFEPQDYIRSQSFTSCDKGTVVHNKQTFTLESPYERIYYHDYTIYLPSAMIDTLRRKHITLVLDTDPTDFKSLSIALFRHIGLNLAHCAQVTFTVNGPSHRPQHTVYLTVLPVPKCDLIKHVIGHTNTATSLRKSSAESSAYHGLLDRLLHASINPWNLVSMEL